MEFSEEEVKLIEEHRKNKILPYICGDFNSYKSDIFQDNIEAQYEFYIKDCKMKEYKIILIRSCNEMYLFLQGKYTNEYSDGYECHGILYTNKEQYLTFRRFNEIRELMKSYKGIINFPNDIYYFTIGDIR